MDIENIAYFVKNAIAEDIGDGDHTSLSTIPKNAIGSAKLIVKEDGIIAGIDLAKIIFNEIDPQLNLEIFKQDGDAVKKTEIVFHVHGPVQSILLAERLVLNCMQRMSGIATTTNSIVELLKPYHTQVLDTRKTTPGLRMLEKWAVKIGGGTNHRMGLYDMILIKDNHVDYAGGIAAAINAANDYLKSQKKQLQIEIEVRDMNELEEVLLCGNVQRIMLDNFSPSEIKHALTRINKQYITEASGGITKDNILDYASTGVDYISMGALTHSVKSLDLSLKAF
ncbi:MAG: carboxylating nicotinate-nucleotide diphosphorylase [Pedobacter sp.]|nr:MAG: carboxylating nicotinate-nucleotide diphosphorylase [Pedobacter sp.]